MSLRLTVPSLPSITWPLVLLPAFWVAACFSEDDVLLGRCSLQRGLGDRSAFYKDSLLASSEEPNISSTSADYNQTQEQLKRKEEVKDILEKQQDVYDRLESKEPHPFWQFDFGQDVIEGWGRLVVCSLLLLLSGALCASAGIGGNIIQVTVLMSGGGLTTTDAVPLSKVVILMGALGSLMVHSTRHANASAGPLICWDSIKVAVPACLFGTSLGVALNPRIPDSCLLFLLAVFLFCISAGVFRQAWLMYREENIAAEALPVDPVLDDEPRTRARGSSETWTSSWTVRPPDEKYSWSATSGSVVSLVLLLTLVVCCGILRELTEKCHDAAFYLGWHAEMEHCQHPVLKIAFFGEIRGDWFQERSDYITAICAAMPVLACMIYGGVANLQAKSKMSQMRIAIIQLVLFSLGLLGSLTGIGGGVVLSPFFLLLGHEVRQAVASSMTCVIFISASSALQYALTNRVRMALAVVYGCINIMGSVAGAYAMYRMARSSVVMVLIGCLVGGSFVIAFSRFILLVS